MKQLLILLPAVLWGCSNVHTDDQTFHLQGAWMLRYSEFPSGDGETFTMDGDGTYCHIYDGDSILYECRIAAAPKGFVIRPKASCKIVLIDKGRDGPLYLEDNDPHPLHIISDTAITIQRNGILYSMVRANDIYREWGAEICDIIADDLSADGMASGNRYVLSVRERQQARYINWLVMVITLVAVLAVTNYVIYTRRRRQLQLQLQQIQEVQEYRPQAVRQVVATVENDFFSSDEYIVLQKRMAEGRMMKDDEWSAVEQHLKRLYPGFTSQLRNLYPMSELEYQVCLLIKLRIAPTDIANVLARDVSTISTVRSRLYKKVFGEKGGAKDWDTFILSIGV